jgi:general secretion pathway protein D
VRIVPLRYISAAEMQRIAAPFLPSGALLEVDTDRNLLTLAGTGQQLEMVLNLIDIFDVDFLRGRSFALVPLSHGAAVRLRDELEAVFASHEDGALEGVIRFVPIERLNALLVISARPEYVDEARRWIEQLDRGAETGERRLYVYPVQNGRASDLAALLGSLFGTEQEAERADDPFPPGVATARIGLASAPIVVPPMGSLAGAAPAVAEGASLADAYGSPAGEPAIETAEHVPGLAAGPASQAREAPGDQAAAGSALARGAFRIIADEPNNALVILATPKEYRTIQDALQHLDVVPLEVLIEATIAEVTLNEQLRYGLQWFFKFGTNSFTFADTGIPTPQFPGFSYLGTSRTDIRVVLNALDRVTDLNVVSSPQLVVLNNNVATLQVGDQVPVVTAQAVNVASDQTLINTIQFIDTGVILRVKPRVNASGLVTLELEQEVSDPIGAGLTPTINQRRIQSTVAVQDGETISLGGLIRDRRSKARNGIPLFSDIPIVGHAFSTTDRTDARTELLVLITPRVIRNRAEARRITEELRRRVRALEGLDSRIR